MKPRVEYTVHVTEESEGPSTANATPLRATAASRHVSVVKVPGSARFFLELISVPVADIPRATTMSVMVVVAETSGEKLMKIWWE